MSQNRLGKNLERLQDDVRRAVGVLDGELLIRGAGTLRVNPEVAISDVEAFMEAVERARAARGAERIAAAEEALMLSVPELLPGAYVERTVIGKKSNCIAGWQSRTGNVPRGGSRRWTAR